jgi:tetratricopeptide (TPR) repeat protein
MRWHRRAMGGLVLLGCLSCRAVCRAQETKSADDATTTTASRLTRLRRLVVSGHDQEAVDQAEALRSEQPHAAGLDLAEGDALYDLGRLQEAEAAYGRALTLDPHDQAAAQMRGLTLFRLGRPKDAIPLLETNHALGAQAKADPTYVLALCYMDTLRYDDARAAFAAQYGFPAESAPAYLVTARMLLRREFKPIAKQYALKALSLHPDLPGAHEVLGEMALGENHLDEAIAEFSKERTVNPLGGVAYERLGDAYTRSGQFTEAARVLQQAVLLEPNATGPYILLGKVLLKESQPAGAMTFLQKAEVMDPANYMTHNLLAQAYRAMGRSADASRELALTEKIQAADEPKPPAPK